ncbi:MAG: SIMPL domain-containing protein [Pseudomonadota bacterium]
MQSGSVLVAAALVAVGLASGGYFIGDGFYEGRKTERKVTVRGLAERETKADIANWKLRFTAADNNLSLVQSRIEGDFLKLRNFLVEAGLSDDEIQLGQLEVVDQKAQQYRSGPIDNNRFIITQNVQVRSTKVSVVEGLSRQTGELVKQGLILQDNQGPSFVFTKLNEVKPDMIAAATKDAREAAEKFAADSGAQVGGIMRASQGYFSIEPLVPTDDYRGAAGQIGKKVRVVTTIDYALKD